jgi:hypothetical protein
MDYEWSYAGQGQGDISILVHGDMYDDTQEPNLKVSFTYKSESTYCIKNEFYGATLALNDTWFEINGARDARCAD